MTKKKTDKVLTDAEIQQRRAAAAKSTGPVTVEGKAASSRNAWKHGLYSQAQPMIKEQWSVGAFGKPCRTSCKYHPENPMVQIPCTLVTEGVTRVGQDCLDKTVYVQAFDSLLQTMKTGDADHMHNVLAGEVAGAFEILQKIREELSEKGIMVWVPMVDKEGKKVGEKPVLNPAMPIYSKMLGDLGINLAELLASPKSISALGQAEDTQDSMAQLLGGALARVGGKRILEHKNGQK